MPASPRVDRPSAHGLANLPLELLRKIAGELVDRSHLQSFVLVCKTTTVPAREALFYTMTIRRTAFEQPQLISHTRLCPHPGLARRLEILNDFADRGEVMSLEVLDLALVLYALPKIRELYVIGHLSIVVPSPTIPYDASFDKVETLGVKTTKPDPNHEVVRLLLSLCHNLTELDLATNLVTLVDPLNHLRPFDRRRVVPDPTAVKLTNLRRLILRSPLYLELVSMNLVDLESLRRIRVLELDFIEESVGRCWGSGATFPIDFFDAFGESIEHLYFKFPLYSRRTEVETLRHVLSRLENLKSLTLGSVSAGAAWLLIGLPATCRNVIVLDEGGTPDWMGLYRFFLEAVNEPELKQLKGIRIWINSSDCQYCDDNFQAEVQRRCDLLGITLNIANKREIRAVTY
ncbi:uncharacterized protein JCM15063_006094 [Sporobolomyces koalae]|uniref:uncharacterized protein n=1 Tax=Sporobolomyces koalae TaxID=500713 RepID=UPI00316D7762